MYFWQIKVFIRCINVSIQQLFANDTSTIKSLVIKMAASQLISYITDKTTKITVLLNVRQYVFLLSISYSTPRKKSLLTSFQRGYFILQHSHIFLCGGYYPYHHQDVLTENYYSYFKFQNYISANYQMSCFIPKKWQFMASCFKCNNIKTL